MSEEREQITWPALLFVMVLAVLSLAVGGFVWNKLTSNVARSATAEDFKKLEARVAALEAAAPPASND